MFKIGDFDFEKSSYFVMKDGKVYRNVVAGLIEEPMRTTRVVNGYKIHADHFDCVLSYSNYYILDPKNNCVYESRDNTIGRIQDLIVAMKTVDNLENFFESIQE